MTADQVSFATTMRDMCPCCLLLCKLARLLLDAGKMFWQPRVSHVGLMCLAQVYDWLAKGTSSVRLFAWSVSLRVYRRSE
jgi:hypothetical protein